MFGFGKKAGPTIGLDINSSTISVLQLEKTKTDLKVNRFASTLTPPEIVREGLLADPEAVGEAVRSLLDSAGYVAKGPLPVANVGIPGQSVVIRLLPVPKGMPSDELNDVVRQEAINNLPFPIEEANIDWSRVPGTSRMDPDGVEREDVLLGAIQRVVVEGYQRMAQVAKITLGRLEISSLAAVRALVLSGQLGKDNALSLVVNIRQDATDITLVNKTVPLFSRSVLLGVETVVESMARSVNASLDEAQSMLPNIQLLGVPTVDPRLGQAAQVARSVCGDLTAEVGRSLEFYMSQVGMVRVDQVLVAGLGLAIPEIDQFIANRLNLRTAIANPFQGIVYDRGQILDERRAYHTMLMGLVAESDAKTVQVDLNQSEFEPATTDEGEGGEETNYTDIDTPWFVPALIVGGIVALLVTGVWAYYQYSLIPAKEAELHDLEEKIQQDKSRYQAMGKKQEEVSALEERKKSLESIVKHGTPMSVILQALKENTPQGVRVSAVKVQGNSATINGQSSNFSKVAHMAINLEGSHVLNNVEIAYIKRLKDRANQINYSLSSTLMDDLNDKTMGVPKEIAENTSDTNVLSSNLPQVLDFSATWCPPCQRLKPIMEQIEHKYSSQLKFKTVDIDDPKNAQLIQKYGITSVPNVFFLDSSGRQVEHIQGFGGSGDPYMAACEKLSKLASKPAKAANK